MDLGVISGIVYC